MSSPGFPAGEVKVRCHTHGYPPVEIARSVAAEEEAVVDLHLAAGARMEIEVRDADGKPFEEVKVSLAREDGKDARYWAANRKRAITGPLGELTLQGVLPGRHRVTFWVGHRDMLKLTIDLEEGKTWNNDGKPIVLER